MNHKFIVTTPTSRSIIKVTHSSAIYRTLLALLYVFTVLFVSVEVTGGESTLTNDVANNAKTEATIQSPVGGVDLGWSTRPGPRGTLIMWTGGTDLPVGGERLIILRGSQPVGFAKEQGRTAVLEIPGVAPPIDELELWRSGHRLDTAVTPSRVPPVVLLEQRMQPAERKVSPPTPGDPGAPGPYTIDRFDYVEEIIFWHEYPAPIEVTAEVTAPVGARGMRPMVIILHGYHPTCYVGGPEGIAIVEWPCPPGWDSTPSHRGYRAIADLLASQGAVVVSVSANGINGQESLSFPDSGAGARSALLRHHLGLWARWIATASDPWGGRFHGAVDLKRVVLVGHSRGGEGIARAVIDSDQKDPWRIRGIVPIAPTAMGLQVPPYVHTAVLLPNCDGDVSNLDGQYYVDGARDLFRWKDRALRTSVLIDGANHSFFNSEWTPGQAASPAVDDVLFGYIDNPRCMPWSPSRLSPTAQQAVAATYTAAMVKFALEDEGGVLGLLDGPEPTPASALGATARTTAIGGNRMPLYEPGLLGDVSTTGDMTASICTPLDPPSVSLLVCTPPDSIGLAPHWRQNLFQWGLERYELPRALRLAWSDEEGATRIDLDRPVNLHRFDRLDVRFIIDQFDGPLEWQVRVIDKQGNSALVSAAPIEPLPGDSYRRLWAQSVSVNLENIKGVNPSRIVALEFVAPGRQGSGFVLDIMARGSTLKEPVGPSLARLNVPDVFVPEGDGPSSTTISVPITGNVQQAGLVWVEIFEFFGGRTGSFREITPPDDTLEIPISWVGDDSYTGYIPGLPNFIISVKPHRNALTGDYIGSVFLIEDDPLPELTITPIEAVGTESSGLTWEISLSAPVDQPIFIQFAAVHITGDVELSVGDIDPLVAAMWCANPALPDVPLSEAFLCPSVILWPGDTTVQFHLPTVTDGVAEGPESVMFNVYSDLGPIGLVTGTVTDF